MSNSMSEHIRLRDLECTTVAGRTSASPQKTVKIPVAEDVPQLPGKCKLPRNYVPTVQLLSQAQLETAMVGERTSRMENRAWLNKLSVRLSYSRTQKYELDS